MLQKIIKIHTEMMFLQLILCQGPKFFFLCFLLHIFGKYIITTDLTLDITSAVETSIFCNMIALMPYSISMKTNFAESEKTLNYMKNPEWPPF